MTELSCSLFCSHLLANGKHCQKRARGAVLLKSHCWNHNPFTKRGHENTPEQKVRLSKHLFSYKGVSSTSPNWYRYDRHHIDPPLKRKVSK